MSVTKTTFLGDKVNERLNQFLRFLEAEKPEFLPPQLDVMGLVRRLAITNPITAAQELPQKLAQSRQMLEEYTPGQQIDPKLLDQFMGLTGFAPAGITAYHGSPYLFRQFDPSRRGTGEGAQAYGVGAGYTAETRDVAEKYSPRDYDYEQNLLKLYSKAEKKQDFTSMEVLESAMMHKRPAELRDMYGKDAESVIKKIEQVQPKSYLYKGDIPDEILPKFLDWDKKFSDQTPEVKEVIKKYWDENKVYGDPTKLSGAGIYDSIVAHVFGDAGRQGAQQAASNELEKIGLRGIRYLDQGSRGEGKGTSNFIPFRAEDYKIQEINDIPVEQWYAKGLLERPLSQVEQARAALEANPGNDELFQTYMNLRRQRDAGLLED